MLSQLIDEFQVIKHLPIALVVPNDCAELLLEESHQHAIEALELRQAEHIELQQVILRGVRL